ncbi:hypothetical protein BVRB_6g154440 [Beta vulgaris subsp. vulgaris]|nr:hypothetical protein BVRB_6g154440 [Beta vulgaris subsp. vulgaris]
MGNTIKSALLVFFFVIAIGLSDSNAGLRCSSTYDCREIGCPCMNGLCTCSYPPADIYSNAPTALPRSSGRQKVQESRLP